MNTFACASLCRDCLHQALPVEKNRQQLCDCVMVRIVRNSVVMKLRAIRACDQYPIRPVLLH